MVLIYREYKLSWESHLECSDEELYLLNCIGYDYDILFKNGVDESKGKITLNDIIKNVFLQGVNELQEQYMKCKDSILDEVMDKVLNYSKNETDESYDELVREFQLIFHDQLHPVLDWKAIYDNTNSSIQLKNIEFYRKYLPDTVQEIEVKMGFVFE